MVGLRNKLELAEVTGFEIDDVGNAGVASSGGEAHCLAPRTDFCGIADVTDTHVVGGVGVEARQLLGGAIGGCFEGGIEDAVRAVLDVPLGAAARLVPSQIDFVRGEVGDGEVVGSGALNGGGGPEHDVVNVEAVTGIVPVCVFPIGPFERVCALVDIERIVVPTGKVLTMGELLLSVNEEVAVVKEGAGSLAHALSIEGDVAGSIEVVSGLNGGDGVVDSSVAAPHTIGIAVVTAIYGCAVYNDPRVGGILNKGELAEVVGFKVDGVIVDAGVFRLDDNLDHGAILVVGRLF